MSRDDKAPRLVDQVRDRLGALPDRYRNEQRATG